MPDLSLVTTSDLIEELFRRTDAVVVASLADRDGRFGDIRTASHGNRLTAMGLCSLAQYRLAAMLESKKES